MTTARSIYVYHCHCVHSHSVYSHSITLSDCHCRCDSGTKNGAIVFNEPGVTRDRIYQRAEWCGREFDVVDTGGLLFDDDQDGPLFVQEIREQAAVALRESCIAVVVVDGREGCVSVIALFSRLSRCRWTKISPSSCGRHGRKEARPTSSSRSVDILLSYSCR